MTRYWLIIILIIYCLITVVFTYPASLHVNDSVLSADAFLTTWILAWDYHQFYSDPFNLFDGNIFYPSRYSLTYSENLIGNLPFTTLLFLIGCNPVFVQNFLCLISFPLCGLTMYIFIRNFIDDGIAAFIGGVLFSFCSYRWVHFQLSHIQVLSAFWIPLIFLSLHKLFTFDNNRNWTFWLLVAFNMLWLSSIYLGLFLVTLVVPFIAIEVVLRGYKQLFRNWKTLVTGIIVTLLLAMCIGYPYFQSRKIDNLAWNINEDTGMSPFVEDFLQTSPDNIVWGNLLGNRTDRESYLFPGITLIILFIAGIFTGSRNNLFSGKDKIVYLVLLFICFLLCLGPNLKFNGVTTEIKLPFWYLKQSMVFFNAIRVPQRIFVYLLFGLTVIAAFGTKSIIDFFSGNSWRKRIAVGLVLSIIILVENLSGHVKFIPIPVGKNIPMVYKWLAQCPEEYTIIELPFDYMVPLKVSQVPYHGFNLFTHLKFVDIAHAQSSNPIKHVKNKPPGNTQFKLLWNKASPLPMYYSVYHWKKIVNGMSGIHPPRFIDIQRKMRRFPDPISIREIEILNLDLVIIHTDQYKKRKAQYIIDTMEEYQQMRLIHIFDEDYVYLNKNKTLQ